MKHLLALGHRRIAFIGHPLNSQGNPLADYVEDERFGAYRDTLREAGSFDQGLISFGAAYTQGVAEAKGHGYRAMKTWLDKGIWPTAVFSSSDILSAGILQAIHDSGRSVPADISLVNYDDTLAPFLTPLLTTVRTPAHEIGVTAASMIIERLENPELGPPREVRLDAQLVQRNSTGPVPTSRTVS